MTNVHSFIHLFSNNLGGDQSSPLSNLSSKVKLPFDTFAGPFIRYSQTSQEESSR